MAEKSNDEMSSKCQSKLYKNKEKGYLSSSPSGDRAGLVLLPMESRMFVSFLLIPLLLCAPPANAADDQLQPQVAVSAQGSKKLTDHVSIRGSGHAFWVPQDAGTDDAMIGIVYAGPKIVVGEHYSIAPQLGAIVNWTGEGDLMPIASAWNWIDVGPMHGFVEAEVYPNLTTGDITYFGFYGIDTDRVPLVWLGAHVEQVGTNVNAGPTSEFRWGTRGFRSTTIEDWATARMSSV